MYPRHLDLQDSSRRKVKKLPLSRMGEEKTPEARRIPKVVIVLPQSLTKITTRNPIIPTNTILPPYPNAQVPLYRSPPLNLQNLSPMYPNYPQSYQIPSPYQNIAPNCANVQSSYRAPPPTYQVKAPLYHNPLPNYQAPMPNF